MRNTNILQSCAMEILLMLKFANRNTIYNFFIISVLCLSLLSENLVWRENGVASTSPQNVH